MKLSLDKPIANNTEDLLDRRSFADSIEKVINSVPEGESLAVGIHGAWGSGKSSLINLIANDLSCSPTNHQDPLRTHNYNPSTESNDSQEICSEEYTVVRFEPWNYVDSNQLLHQFFFQVSRRLSLNKKNEQLYRIAELIAEYGDTLSFVDKIIPLPLVSSVVSGFKAVHKRQKQKRADLSYQKEELSKALENYKKKIVIIIDDIDRLLSEQISLIFQLVASIAKLPNIIYILAFDRNLASRALYDFQRVNGDEFLEKIIQFSIALPQARSSQITDLFNERLKELLHDDDLSNIDRKYWTKVLISCIEPKLNNIRDLNRLMNAFSLLLDAFKSFITPPDLFIVAIIQIWNPELLPWLYRYSNLICGAAKGSNNTYRDESYGKAIEDLRLLLDNRENKEYWLTLLKIVFPRLSLFLSGKQSEETETQLKMRSRIADGDRLAAILEYSLANKALIGRESYAAITDYPLDLLLSKFKQWESSGQLGDYLRALEETNEAVSDDRIDVLFQALILFLGKTDNVSRGITEPTIDDRLMHVAEILLDKLDRPLAIKLINMLIPNIDEYSFIQFARFLIHKPTFLGNDVEPSSRRAITTTTNAEDPSILLRYTERLADIAEHLNILEIPGSYEAILIWRRANEYACNKRVKKWIDTSDLAKAMYATATASRWESTKEIGWECDISSTAYYSTSSVTASIQRLRMTKAFWNLPKSYRQKIAAYALQVNQLDNADNSFAASDEQINQLLKSWKTEFRTFLQPSNTDSINSPSTTQKVTNAQNPGTGNRHK